MMEAQIKKIRETHLVNALGCFLQTREKKSFICNAGDFPKDPCKPWLMSKVFVKGHLQDQSNKS